MNQIYQDENKAFQFDFSAALWASDALHDTYKCCKVGILSDVDFIAETDDYIILVEYKNATVPGAARPEAFQPSDQKRENKIAFKYYDSWIYLAAIQKTKPIKYVYILEYPNSDSVTRRRIRNRIAALLPFRLQLQPEIKIEMIHDFEVLTISEWNSHTLYQAFPITPLLPPTPSDTQY